MRKSAFILFFLCCAVTSSFAQKAIMDSLQRVLKTAKEDTNKLYTLNLLSWYAIYAGEYDLSLQCSDEVKTISEKLLSGANSDRLTVKIKKHVAKANGFIGSVYMYRGNFPEALSSYLKSLKTSEEIKDDNGIADSYNSLGNIYSSQNNFAEAHKQYSASLKMREKLHDTAAIAGCYNNIGYTYLLEGKNEDALKCHLMSLKLFSQTGDKTGIAYAYTNIGNSYAQMGKYDESLKNHLEALKIRESLGSKPGVTAAILNIGGIYSKQGKTKLAKEYLSKGLAMAKEIGGKEYIHMCYKSLSEVNTTMGNGKEALQDYKMYILYRDSLFNEENTKKTVRLEMNYEFDKKETAAKLVQERKQAVADAESRKQKMIIWIIVGILVLVIAFAFFAYRSYLQKQKANKAITEQKEIIEEKQKEILDSIHYAKRIQMALLPTEKYIARNLNR